MCVCVCAPRVHVKRRLNNSLVLWCFIVRSYFVMMGILTLFSTFVEKNYFYIAKERREGGIVRESVSTDTTHTRAHARTHAQTHARTHAHTHTHTHRHGCPLQSRSRNASNQITFPVGIPKKLTVVSLPQWLAFFSSRSWSRASTVATLEWAYLLQGFSSCSEGLMSSFCSCCCWCSLSVCADNTLM